MKSLLLVTVLVISLVNNLTNVESASHFFTRKNLMSTLLKKHLEKHFPNLFNKYGRLFKMKTSNYVYDMIYRPRVKINRSLIMTALV